MVSIDSVNFYHITKKSIQRKYGKILRCHKTKQRVYGFLPVSSFILLYIEIFPQRYISLKKDNTCKVLSTRYSTK